MIVRDMNRVKSNQKRVKSGKPAGQPKSNKSRQRLRRYQTFCKRRFRELNRRSST